MNARLAKASKRNCPKPATFPHPVCWGIRRRSRLSSTTARNWHKTSSIEDREGMCMCPAGPWHDMRRSEECCFRTGDCCYSICSELFLGDSLPSLPSALLTSIQRMVSHCYLHNQQTWIQQWILYWQREYTLLNSSSNLKFPTHSKSRRWTMGVLIASSWIFVVQTASTNAVGEKVSL